MKYWLGGISGSGRILIFLYETKLFFSKELLKGLKVALLSALKSDLVSFHSYTVGTDAAWHGHFQAVKFHSKYNFDVERVEDMDVN